MNSQTTAALFLTLLLGGLGCQSSNLDKHWGESYRAAVERQTAEPEVAAVNADEPAPQGLDGGTADDVMGRYRKQQQPAASSQEPFTMLMSGGSETEQ